MPTTMDRIRAHYQALGTREIEVPEWELKLQAKPLTVGDKQWILDKAGDDEFRQLVYTLIRCARLPDGEWAFTIADRPALEREADERVIRRVASQILAGPGETELGN